MDPSTTPAAPARSHTSRALSPMGNGSDGFYEIVGVVGSVRYEGLDSSPRPTMYIPYKQDVFSGMVRPPQRDFMLCLHRTGY